MSAGNKKICIGLLIGCILILFFVGSINTIGHRDENLLPILDSNETYRLLSRELIPSRSTPLFTVNDEKIFLFYDRDGLINVYSHEGDFLYGLQIETTEHGTGNITSDEKYLYIKSCGNTLYIFEDTALLCSICRSEYPDTYAKINRGPNHSIDDTTFYYLSESNSIAQRTNNGPFRQIITMPEEGTDALGICVLLLGIGAFAHYARLHYRHEKG